VLIIKHHVGIYKYVGVNLWLVSYKYVVKELIVNIILYSKNVTVKGFCVWM
jgi:hypothetical protein